MRWIARTAIVGAIYSAGVLAWLLLPGAHPVPAPVWLVAFAGMLPLFAVAVIFMRRYLRVGLGIWLRVLRQPGALAFAAVTLFVGVVAFVHVSPPGRIWPGQPEIVHGQYVLYEHGRLTPVTRTEYLRAAEVGQRNFVLVGLAFYVATVILVETGQRLRRYRRVAR